jgi:hypothetical protein
VALRTATLRHFFRELLAMGIRVAIGARLFRYAKVGARPWRRVARGAGGGGVLSRERKARRRMRVHTEERGTESRGCVARLALASVGSGELATVLVGVTVGTAREGELSIAILAGEPWFVASPTARAFVLAGEQKRRAGMRGEPDRTR